MPPLRQKSKEADPIPYLVEKSAILNLLSGFRNRKVLHRVRKSDRLALRYQDGSKFGVFSIRRLNVLPVSSRPVLLVEQHQQLPMRIYSLTLDPVRP